MRVVASVIVLALAAASCTDGSPAPGPTTSPFTIESVADGCGDNLQAELTHVDLDGSVRWTTAVPWLDRGPAPAGSKDVVVVATASPRGLVAVNVKTGDGQWQVPTATPVTALQPLSGGVVLAQTDTELVAHDLLDGSRTWRWTAEGRLADPSQREVGLPVEGARVFVNDSGTVRAIDLTTGDEVWSHDTRADGEHRPIVVPAHDLVLQPTSRGIIAVDLRNGFPRWRWDAPDGLALLRVNLAAQLNLLGAVVGERGPDGDLAHGVRGIDVQKGLELGSSPTPASPDQFTSIGWERDLITWRSTIGLQIIGQGEQLVDWTRWVEGFPEAVDLTVVDGVIVLSPGWKTAVAGDGAVGHGTKLAGVDRAIGEVLWEGAGDGDALSPVRVGHGLLAFGTTSLGPAEGAGGRLLAIDPGTGKEAFAHELRDDVRHRPVSTAQGFVALSSDAPQTC